MRWQDQHVDAEDIEALPGLTRIPGLLRSVKTPEFAGVTFHEVCARSVLNEIPAASMVPFRWTVNPYRGCTHACRYCLAGDTLVLMGYGRVKPLSEVRAGDQVVGTELRDGVRHYVRTDVQAHWQTVKAAYRVELDDGTVLVASADHRFLTDDGWASVNGVAPGGEPARTLTAGAMLTGPGRRLGSAAKIASLSVPGNARLRVLSIQPLDRELPMFDVTTGTGDFIANGVVSHNCFARGSHSWLELDTGNGFDTEIVVKVNAAEVLARELSRPTWQRDHVALGTNTDPYQRAEGRYRLMPGIITALANERTPFSLLTKGTLLRRDLPLIAEAAQHVPVGLGVSIAILDPGLHLAVEPGTPSPRARLELVRAIRDAGFDCSVLLAPVLPWLTDSVEQLDAALGTLADAGATAATVIPLHLRPGAREWFLAWLARDRPDLVPRYEQLYVRGAYVPREYRDRLARRVKPLLARHGLDRPNQLRASEPPPNAATDPAAHQLALL